MSVRFSRFVFALLCVVFALYGCGSDEGTPPAGANTKVQGVGPEGGTVVSLDGKVTLVIPPGALSERRDITIEPSDKSRLGSEWAAGVNAGHVGEVYELGPSGTTFAVPIRASLRLDKKVLPANGALRVSPDVLLSSANGAVIALAKPTLDIAQDGVTTLSADMSHFSPLTRSVAFLDDAEAAKGFFFSIAQQDESRVGEPFEAKIYVEAKGAGATTEYGGSVRQVDEEKSPILTATPSMVSLSTDGNGLAANAELTCRREAKGVFYRHLVNLNVSNAFVRNRHLFFGNIGEWFDEGVTVSVVKNHDCVAGVPYPLNVSVTGTGDGTVTSDPAGITCSKEVGPCSASFPSLVYLTAKAKAGSKFVRWTSSATSDDLSNALYVLRMRAETTVTAEFETDPDHPAYPVTVAVSGTGDGTVTSSPVGITCSKETGPCSAEFADTVRLTAQADANSKFIGWTQDGVGGTAPVDLAMNGAKQVGAVFEKLPAITVVVTGQGSVSGAPFTAPCTETCTQGVNTAANQVTLTATPQAGWLFDHWGGAASGTNPSTFLVVDVDKSVDAVFVQVSHAGNYTGLMLKGADPATHDPFVFNVGAGGKSTTFAITKNGSAITLVANPQTTPSAFPVLSGTLQGNDSFFLVGTGTIAGFTNVRVEATGTVNGTTLVITSLVVGAAGGTSLPTGQPITYTVNATK